MSDSDTAPTPELTVRLVALLRQGHTDTAAFGATLSLEERERTGAMDAWAPKEYVGHMAYWRDRETDRILARSRGEQGESYEDFQPLNTESFPDLAANTWEQAIERSRQSTEAMIAALEAAPEGLLHEPMREPDANGAPSVLEMAVNNGYGHPEQHLYEMTRARGDVAGAAVIAHRVRDAIVALRAGPELAANASYNLACALAASGPREEVLGLLRESFAANPRLTGWAREDTDLDPLRDDPAFQELVGGGQG